MESKAPAALQQTLQPAFNTPSTNHSTAREHARRTADSAESEMFHRRRQYLSDHIDDFCDCVDQVSFEI